MQSSNKRSRENQENEGVEDGGPAKRLKQPEVVSLPGHSADHSAFKKFNPPGNQGLFSNVTNNRSLISPQTESKLFQPIIEDYRVFERKEVCFDGVPCFIRAKILKNESKQDIKGVLSLDMDNTLIDYDRSLKEGKPVFLNKEKAQEEIKKAKERNYKVVITTARPYSNTEQAGTDFLTIINILNELSKGSVDEIYFTNANEKVHPLLFLCHIHNLKYEQICHKDDDDGYLEPCIDLGFHCVQVKPNSEDHYDKVSQFLESNASCSMSVSP